MSHTIIDNRFRDIIDEHATVRQLGTGFTFTEGPIWHPTEKHLLFSDMPADVRRQWQPQSGQVTEVLRPSNKANGMTYDHDLNLLVCEHSTSSVARFRPDGTREVLCSISPIQPLAVWITLALNVRLNWASRASTDYHLIINPEMNHNWSLIAICSVSQTDSVLVHVNAGCGSMILNRQI